MVFRGRIAAEPFNLGRGWVGFDFEVALGKPVRIINDAAMQAVGSYTGGRMLFLGLGTGMGATLILDGVVEPMEFGHLPYKRGLRMSSTSDAWVGASWQKEVAQGGCRGRRTIEPRLRGRVRGPGRRQCKAPEGNPQAGAPGPTAMP